jgi:hypothetical protein
MEKGICCTVQQKVIMLYSRRVRAVQEKVMVLYRRRVRAVQEKRTDRTVQEKQTGFCRRRGQDCTGKGERATQDTATRLFTVFRTLALRAIYYSTVHRFCIHV